MTPTILAILLSSTGVLLSLVPFRRAHSAACRTRDFTQFRERRATPRSRTK